MAHLVLEAGEVGRSGGGGGAHPGNQAAGPLHGDAEELALRRCDLPAARTKRHAPVWSRAPRRQQQPWVGTWTGLPPAGRNCDRPAARSRSRACRIRSRSRSCAAAAASAARVVTGSRRQAHHDPQLIPAGRVSGE